MMYKCILSNIIYIYNQEERKMKKILSIILALAMLASMIPAAFAGDAVEPLEVTFSFINGGRSDVNQTSLETITKVDEETYTSAWTNYKNFPTNPASPNENWAYAGSTVVGAVGAGSFVNCTTYTGTGFVSAANQWLAFKVKVPKTAKYRVTNMQAYKYGNATTNLEVYIFPSDERFVEGNAIYGTVVPPTDPTNSKIYCTRGNVTTFDKLNINATLLGRGSESASTGGNAEVVLADKTDVDLVAGEEYILLFNNAIAGKVITATSITLTEIMGNENTEIVEEPEFNFTKSALKDTSIGKLEKITDTSMISPTVSTGLWKTHFASISNNAIQSDGTLFCYYKHQAEAGEIFWVIKAEVAKLGTYVPTISFVKQTYNGIVDFYNVPASYANEKHWTLQDVASVKAAIADSDAIGTSVGYLASIDMHKDSADTTPIVGNAAFFTEDNYIIMRVRKGPNKSSHGNEYYYGYVSSIKLNTASAALRLSMEDASFEPGDSQKISAKAIGSNGIETAISSITYESLNSEVATVDATGTVLGKADGTAIIKATATVGETTVTSSIVVTIKKIWDPRFVFTSAAVKKHTSTNSNIYFNQIIALDDVVTTGLWEFVTSKNLYAHGFYGDGIQYSVVQKNFGDNAIVLKLNFSEAGTYAPTFGGMMRNFCGKQNVYIVPKSYADGKWTMQTDNLPVAEIVADKNVTHLFATNLYTDGTAASNPIPFEADVVNIDEKENYLIFVLENNDENVINDGSKRLWGYPNYLAMTRTGSVKLLADKATLSKGDTTTLIAKTKDNRDNAVEAEVTLTSLNTAVATVSGNTVTAVAPGVATIKATATVDGVAVSDTIEITVGDETVAKSVSIATSIDGAKADIRSYARGSRVTVSAPEIEGKVFRHWVRGTATNGDWVSADAEYSFTATTHTYLTAIYTNEATGKLVEFFNGNGEYLSEAVADANDKVALPANPSITGYVFDKWLLDKNTEFTAETILTADVTRVVAEYKDADKTYTVNGESYKYGDEATFTSDSDVVWKRNDKAVAYGKSYTYYVWDDATIEGTSGNAEPMVVLDADVKDGNAYMIEYDACGKNIVEVGIIFGNGNHTVDSCDSKATSQRGLSRGQFTAKPGSGNTVARGYLVYEENGAYKVVYSK